MSDQHTSSAEWAFVRTLLKNIRGEWHTPPQAATRRGGLVNMPTAALLGNGDVGVVIGAEQPGSANHQVFHIAKNDFWTDDTARGNPSGSTANHTGVRPLPVGKISLRVLEPHREGNSAYRMEQDILHAEVRTALPCGNHSVHVRAFVAAKAPLLIAEITNDHSSAIRLAVEVQAKTGDAYMPLPAHDADDDPGETTYNSARYPVTAEIVEGTAIVSRCTNVGMVSDAVPPEWIAKAVIGVQSIGAPAHFATVPGQPGLVSGELALYPGSSAVLLCAIKCQRCAPHKAESSAPTNQVLAALSPLRSQEDIAKVQVCHRQWWREYWLRAYLDTGDTALNAFYYGQLYILGSAIREGQPAPGLYGPWCTSEAGGWRYYTMNYNFVATFYGLYAANRLPFIHPMLDATLSWQKNAEAWALAKYGHNGLCYPTGIGPDGMRATATDCGQKGNALLSAVMLIRYHEYAQDASFLRQLLPWLNRLMLFWEQELAEEDGRWCVLKSAARETVMSDNPLIDLAALQRVLPFAIKHANAMGVSPERVARWQDYLERLHPLPTFVTPQGALVFREDTTHDRISLFVGDGSDAAQQDLTSNLLPAYPCELLGPDSDPELLQTARNTLAVMHAWNQNNSFTHVFSQAARIGADPDIIFHELRHTVLANRQGNLLVNVGMGHGIDNCGAIDAIHALLLQFHEGVVWLFPAWNLARDASFTRLRVPGAFLVSAVLRGGEVLPVHIYSEQGGEFRLALPWICGRISVLDGGQLVPHSLIPDRRLSFACEPGHLYTVQPS